MSKESITREVAYIQDMDCVARDIEELRRTLNLSREAFARFLGFYEEDYKSRRVLNNFHQMIRRWEISRQKPAAPVIMIVDYCLENLDSQKPNHFIHSRMSEVIQWKEKIG